MTTNKKVILCFSLILTIKLLLILALNSTFLFPSEACSSIQAQYLKNWFQYANCDAIYTGTKIPSSFPLYSILIAPLYAIFTKSLAYKSAIFLNILITSTLVYPLSKLAKKITKKDNISILIAVIVTLSAPIMGMEKLLVPDALAITSTIWITYLYINKKINTAYILSIITSFLSIIGIFTNIALTVSEIVNSKNRKIISLVFLPISIVLLILFFTLINQDAILYTHKFFFDIEFDPNFFRDILIAFKESINTISLGTLFFLPITLKMLEKSIYKQFRTLFITLLILSFLSTNYLIFIKGLSAPATNYISLISLLVQFFALTLITKQSTLKLNKIDISFIIIAISALITIDHQSIQSHLNLLITPNVLTTIIISTILFIGTFALQKNKKIQFGLITFIFIISSIWTNFQTIDYSRNISKTSEKFLNTKEKILFIAEHELDNNISKNYWRLTSQSDNNVQLIFMTVPYDPYGTVTMPIVYKEKIEKEEFNYVISTINFNNLNKIETVEAEENNLSYTEYIYSSDL